MKNTLKPCDCKDMVTAKQLDTQGVTHGDRSISIEPNVVIMTIGGIATIRIPMSTFKLFAEWYLEPQELK